MYNLPATLRRHTYLAALLLVLVLVVLAYVNRFVQDDAFISFRYARHLCEGYGLTWNVNEPPVEGYTNFLWTLLMAIPHCLDLPVVEFSYAVGLLCFLGTLLLTWHTARYALDETSALLALLLLGTNYSFSAYATGGMETQLQTMLFMTSVVITLNMQQRGAWLTPRLLLALSTVVGLALLTRLDSAVLLGPLVVAVAFNMMRQPVPLSRKLTHLAMLGLPAAILILPWLAWKLAYYGDLLPNTYYVKVDGAAAWTIGLHYLAQFLLSYLWILLIPLMILSARRLNEIIRWMLVPVGLWLLYLVRIGGDFMEFRMLVPILPITFIYVTWLCLHTIRNRYARIVLIVLVLAGSLHHALYFSYSGFNNYLNTISLLKEEMREDRADGWISVGRTLGNALSGDPTITFAAMPAGAIPYYAGVTTVDILGLNDRWVARYGSHLSDQPGHGRYAPWEYLLSRDVHLLIGQPLIVPVDINLDTVLSIAGYRAFHVSLADPGLLPSDARILEVPLGETHKFYLLYLKPHPRIDALIQSGEWKAYPIQRL